VVDLEAEQALVFGLAFGPGGCLLHVCNLDVAGLDLRLCVNDLLLLLPGNARHHTQQVGGHHYDF
jgi:hypothetical protein